MLLGRLAVACVVGQVGAEDDAVTSVDRADAPRVSTGTGTSSQRTLATAGSAICAAFRPLFAIRTAQAGPPASR